MSTIPQNPELLKNLFAIIAAYRPIFKQDRVYQRVVALVLGLLFRFGRGTMTQVLMALGLTESDWSGWYRIFSHMRFDPEQASEILLEQSLDHIAPEDLLVVGGDGTQIPRTSRKIEGTGWIRNMRTPVFKIGIHLAQRWFNFSLLLPPENGYSRALPLRFIPAFTPKSHRKWIVAYTEWRAAVLCLHWLLGQLRRLGREKQKVLMVADGGYDTVEMWKALPEGIILLVRTAKNRALYFLPEATAHKSRKYGHRAPAPQEVWQDKNTQWRKCRIRIRGRRRKLSYRVIGPVVRRGAASRPLFLVVVRGQHYKRNGRDKHREPIAYLVNAIQDAQGQWVLPLPAKTLLFWTWQRWELEVCHREAKSNFGLGEMQCSNPVAAVISVQFVAWVYAILLLAGYRTWGLSGSPDVPTLWWRGARRWSFNTLWRSYRAALWSSHDFRPLCALTTDDWGRKEALFRALANSTFGSVRL